MTTSTVRLLMPLFKMVIKSPILAIPIGIVWFFLSKIFGTVPEIVDDIRGKKKEVDE